MEEEIGRKTIRIKRLSEVRPGIDREEIKVERRPQEDKPAGALEIQLLTCSPETWAKNQNREITAYKLVGVSTAGQNESYESAEKSLRRVAKELGCEVVIDVRITLIGDYATRYIGTGMILQNDKQTTEGEQ